MSERLSTIGKALAWARSMLRAVTDWPQLEAERILAEICELPRASLIAHPERSLAPEERQIFTDHVLRRASGVPLPYILGHIEFFGLDLYVAPEVLIPRPETETLVEMALAWARQRGSQTVLDVGTGSGCIAIALAVTLPHLSLLATDLSIDALRVAHRNARRHSVRDRIHLIRTDLLQALRGPIDLIVSNPPYVADTEWHHLPPSVRQEPTLALRAGPEGLDVIRRLLIQARTRLAPGGCLLVEIGEHQGPAVIRLAREIFGPHGPVHISVHQDLAGRDRVLQVQIIDAAGTG